MPNTQRLLPKWLDAGKREGYSYMAVILDISDNFNEYPAFFTSQEECQEDIDDFDVLYICEHERLMEVYDLTEPLAPQLDIPRHFALKPKSHSL